MKVLVVEDNDYDRSILINLVNRTLKCEVDSACSISEAKQKIQDHNLIILDLQLPEETGGGFDQNGGKKVLEYIRSKYLEKNPFTIIVVSQFREDSLEAEQIRKEHLFYYISAWFHKSEDRQKLSEFLSEHNFHSNLKE